MSAHTIPWQRVTRATPCPVCGKPDWCALGERYINCMRIQSAKPCENGGWLHPLDSQRQALPRREEPKRLLDLQPIYRRWLDRTEDRHWDQLSRLLGIEQLPLRALGAAWAEEHDAWAFPMVNSDREVTGVRLRNERGEKWAVRGGKNGLFVPRSNVPPSRRCYICEGPTDTAALLSIGLFTIGRPSCNEGSAILNDLLPALGVREAVIVADHDSDKQAPDGRAFNPGVDGALGLSLRLPVPNCIWIPPTKDAREFVKCGGSAIQIENAVKVLKWNATSRSG